MEFILTRALLDAHRTGKIKDDSDLAELIKLENAYKAKSQQCAVMGLTVVPLVSYKLLERLKDPIRQRRYFFMIGFCYYTLLWPVRPEAMKDRLRALGPRYRDVILEGKPENAVQYLSKVIDAIERNASRNSSAAMPTLVPAQTSEVSIERNEPTAPTRMEALIEKRSPYRPVPALEPSWERDIPTKEAQLSPYLSPEYAEKPYVYGSLSSSFHSSDKH